MNDLDTLISNSEGQIADSKENNVEELDKKINEEKEKIVAQIEKLTSESLMSKATIAKEALDELSKIKKKADDSVKRLDQYKKYQEILEVNPGAIKEIEDFQKKFDVRHKLWKNREKFAEYHRKWYFDNFMELDANEIVTIVKEYEKDNLLLKQQLPRD